MSRRGGLLSYGAAWDKYNYNFQVVKDLTGYKLSDWVTLGSGTFEGEWSGHTSYKFEIVPHPSEHYDRYQFKAAGAGITVSKANPGTVYNVDNLSLVRVTIDSEGNYTSERQTIESTYTNETWEWFVGNRIGVVRAKEGTYPDEGRSYSYYTTEGDYIIMESPDKAKYAYNRKG